ncbi:MAG: hypothetical protein ACRD0R_00260 [Acidimicrobiales bacterium]|jgi:hypothetical protein
MGRSVTARLDDAGGGATALTRPAEPDTGRPAPKCDPFRTEGVIKAWHIKEWHEILMS